MSLVFAIGVCYHACLQEGRQDYREAVAKAFREPCVVPGGANQILLEITRLEKKYLSTHGDAFECVNLFSTTLYGGEKVLTLECIMDM